MILCLDTEIFRKMKKLQEVKATEIGKHFSIPLANLKINIKMTHIHGSAPM